MARTITTSAVLWYGATPALVTDIIDIKYTSPARTEITSNGLNEDVPNVIGISARGAYKLVITVEIDKSDTNGQVAMDTLYGSKASGTINYYPEGNTTGNKKYAGTAYITDIPNSGGQGRDKIKNGDYTVTFDGAPTITTI